jgi:hypothetical protein
LEDEAAALCEAQETANAGIILHTISLGDNADLALMEEMARIGSGTHHFSPTQAELEAIFDDILSGDFSSGLVK